MEYVIGIDIGTTSTKAVAYTLGGEVVAHHAVDYPLLQPEPGAAEQEPELIVQAVQETLRMAVAGCPPEAREIVCVSFSAAMHSVIAIGADDRPLTRSITWADNRAAFQADRLRASGEGHAIYLRTGTPIHPMSPLVKLAWLHEAQPGLVARAVRFVGIKELVFFRLFGVWVVDHSIASATGLLNLAALDWDDAALQVAGVRREQLSMLVPTTHCLHGLDPALAARLGLAADTPFVVGANDGVLSNLGLGAMQPGEVAVTIGTSGALRCVVDRPLTDREGRTFCYALTERHWVVGGPVNNGGIVLRWLRDALVAGRAANATADATPTAGPAEPDPYESLMRLAERAPAGAGGLLFHPYLNGERAPHWRADLRGSFFGLAAHHGQAHMVRAALEGVIFNILGILPAVESLVGPSRSIKATGGFARSALWRQTLADVFDREVTVPESFESSCLGAAVLGLYALGRVASLDVVSGMVGTTHLHRPIAAHVAVYAQLRPIFEALPVQLDAQYRQIAAFQAGMGGARARQTAV